MLQKMRIPVVISALLIAAATAVAARQQPAPSGVPTPIAQVLADIKKRDTGALAVSEEDGQFLRILVSSRNAQRVLEIGGASGYSAIWMGLGLRDTGGRLVSI